MKPDNIVNLQRKKLTSDKKVPRMVSIADAAEITGLPYSFIYKGCIEERITHIKSGRRRYVNLDLLIDQLNGVEHKEAKA